MRRCDPCDVLGGQGPRFRHLAGHPFFVDSAVSELIQVADVAAYAFRRYVDRQEEEMLRLVLPRFDRHDGRLVGVRHYRGAKRCGCLMCAEPR